MSESMRIDIKGRPIWFEKFGTGPKPILFIPDAIGTGRTDYPAQLQGPNALDKNEFTMIAVESPGWGRSRPPERKYDANIYNSDCEVLFTLMQELGYEKFSIVGFGEGAKVALLITVKYSDNIQALVLNSVSIANKEYAIKYMNSIKSIEKWDEERLEDYLNVYGSEELIQDLWTKYVKFYGYYNQYFPNDICNNRYKNIKCPTLVMHGDQDPITDLDQASYVNKSIRMSKLHRFAASKHNFHTRNAKAWKELVEPHFMRYMRDDWSIEINK